MNLQPKDQLATVAARLARSSPNMWAEMVVVLDGMVATAQKECIGAVPSKILVAQGRAQQIMELRDTLAGAIERVRELEDKKKLQEQRSLRPNTRTPNAFNV